MGPEVEGDLISDKNGAHKSIGVSDVMSTLSSAQSHLPIIILTFHTAKQSSELHEPIHKINAVSHIQACSTSSVTCSREAIVFVSQRRWKGRV